MAGASCNNPAIRAARASEKLDDEIRRKVKTDSMVLGVWSEMNESTDLFRHTTSGKLYAIRRKGSGDLIGSAGPLDEGRIDDLEALPVTVDNNAWIQENREDLILVSPLDVGKDN